MIITAGGYQKPRLISAYMSSAGANIPSGAVTLLPIDGINVITQIVLTDPDMVQYVDLINFRLLVPPWCREIELLAKITFPNNVAPGVLGMCSTHIWRNGQPTGEQFYHQRQAYVLNSGNVATWAISPRIKASLNDYWDLRGFQNSGQIVTVGGFDTYINMLCYP